MNSDKTATLLKCSALVTYFVHLVWLTFTSKRRKYLIHSEYAMLGFHPVGKTEVGTENMEGGADMDGLQ